LISTQVVECDSVALRRHFNTTKGREENPEFGCHHGHHPGNAAPSRFDAFLGLSNFSDAHDAHSA